MPRYNEVSPLGYDLDLELEFIEVDGVRYQLGSAGSLIIICERCGEEHFREPDNYFSHPEWHQCFICKPAVQMQPIALQDLPRWNERYAEWGFKVVPVDKRRAARLAAEPSRPWRHAFGRATEADFPLGHVAPAPTSP